jgi:sulfatase maturation enzyme AslB (radical SAM superfamily)
VKVLSRFAHSASHTHHALFNALNLELVYGTDALKTLVDDFQQPRDEAAYLAQAPRQRALLETLVKLGMLVDPGDDNRQLVQANVARLERPSPVTSMYLVPTRHCNIRCQYCTFAEGRVSAE